MYHVEDTVTHLVRLWFETRIPAVTSKGRTNSYLS